MVKNGGLNQWVRVKVTPQLLKSHLSLLVMYKQMA